MYTRNMRKEAADKVHYSFFNVNEGQATLAYVKTDDESMFYEVAFCAPSDNFCRETGKQIARRKLFASQGNHKITLNCVDPRRQAVELRAAEIRPQWCGGRPSVEYRESRRTRKGKHPTEPKKPTFWKKYFGFGGL